MHSVLLRGRQHCLLWGHGASVFHHSPIHHTVTQAPACQDSQHALPGVRGVWILGAPNQEMITTSRDARCGLVVMPYMLGCRSSILRLKFTVRLRSWELYCTDGISFLCRAETWSHFPEFWQISRGRTIKIFEKQFGFDSLSSFFLDTKPADCFLCQPEGVRPLWRSSRSTAILLTWQWIHLLQLTRCLWSHFVAQ